MGMRYETNIWVDYLVPIKQGQLIVEEDTLKVQENIAQNSKQDSEVGKQTVTGMLIFPAYPQDSLFSFSKNYEVLPKLKEGKR